MSQPVAPLTQVKVYNTNLDRVLSIEVPVENGRPLEEGDYVVPGVPGTGAKIMVDFADTAGAATGALLPTGNPTDRLTIPDFGEIEASLVDTGNAHVFVRARDLGLKGTETAAEIDRDAGLAAVLERIRGVAAARMGMVSAPEASRDESPAAPLIGMVGPPADYRDALGDRTSPGRGGGPRLPAHVHAADAQDLRGDEHRLHGRRQPDPRHGGP